VYVEQLAQLLGVQLDDRAFSGAEASDSSPPVLPLPINLSEQVEGYIAGLNGHSVPLGTEALINIGGNDYEAYLQSNLPKVAGFCLRFRVQRRLQFLNTLRS
jgi:hypothetical protein